MACEKDWLYISSALLTPVIAILGSIIAIMQYRINKARLRYELFDRKYEIFEATKTFLSSVITHGKTINDDRIIFLRNTKGSFVFYKKDITEYLYTLHKKSLALNLHASKSEHDAECEVLKWFGEQIENIDEVFKGALKIEN